MPNIKSVKKDVIKSRKNHLRNISAKSAMKTFIKKARVAIDSATDRSRCDHRSHPRGLQDHRQDRRARHHPQEPGRPPQVPPDEARQQSRRRPLPEFRSGVPVF